MSRDLSPCSQEILQCNVTGEKSLPVGSDGVNGLLAVATRTPSVHIPFGIANMATG